MPIPASPLCFQHVHAAATLGYRAVTAHRLIFLLAADSTRVDARKHVNASVYAVAARIPLALLTLTPEELSVTPQQPAGGEPMKALAYPAPDTLNAHRRPHAACHRMRRSQEVLRLCFGRSTREAFPARACLTRPRPLLRIPSNSATRQRDRSGGNRPLVLDRRCYGAGWPPSAPGQPVRGQATHGQEQ